MQHDGKSLTPDRNDPTPMYHQIQRGLEEQMLLGKLPLDAQVPPEQRLCEVLGVSRITVRRALDELHKLGIIERTRGRGTFVRKLPMDNRIGPLGEIAVLTYDPQTFTGEDWGAGIIRALDSRLPGEGFHATYLPVHPTAKGFKQVWQQLDALGSRLAGVTGFASPDMAPLFDALDQRGIPWVSLKALSREQTHNFVSANNFAGGERVGRELARWEKGPTLFISTDLKVITNTDKFFGFLQGWLTNGSLLADIQNFEAASPMGLNDEECARVRGLLAGKNRPRSVFCAGDLLASSVLKICRSSHLTVPEDVAVVGGTGLMLAEHTTPALTVLAQPMVQIGHAAEAMLVEMIRTKQTRLPGRYIPCPLIRRASCPIGDVL